MTNFTIQQANMITDDFEWHLHRTDCKDNNHRKYYFSDPYRFDAEDAADAIEIWHDAEMLEMGWTPEVTKVFACTERAS